MNKSVKFLGLEFSCGDLDGTTRRLTEIEPTTGTAYHLVNAYSLVMANESPRLYSLLKKDVLICDGKPLARALKRGVPSLQQIRGADLMRQVISESTPSARHFFLGSTDEVLRGLIAFAQRTNPDIEISGYYSPEFTENFYVALPTWLKKIRESNATIVWVGLGTPKQDYVAHDIAQQIPVHAVAIGAAFDYLSGNISEAPKLIQHLGLEWFYRLMKEPRRLAGRYLVGNLKFLRLILVDYIIPKK
jgi:N-acetylglucosaminyldiphosphoundecaprenol N-acetyl-beta-D-mannosaminyltransferase